MVTVGVASSIVVSVPVAGDDADDGVCSAVNGATIVDTVRRDKTTDKAVLHPCSDENTGDGDEDDDGATTAAATEDEDDAARKLGDSVAVKGKCGEDTNDDDRGIKCHWMLRRRETDCGCDREDDVREGGIDAAKGLTRHALPRDADANGIGDDRMALLWL